jgi:hypothetical protein
MTNPDANRTETAWLTYPHDGTDKMVVLSPDTSSVTVGRSPDVDVPLTADPEASRLHAALERIGTHWTITDQGMSTNGTFVNGWRLAGRRRLFSGDLIRIGMTTLQFHDHAGSSAETMDAEERAKSGSVTAAQRAVLIALCSPYRDNAQFATPATNEEIAQQLGVNIETIKRHLQALFATFSIDDLAQNQKRKRLVQRAMNSGIVDRHSL